MLALLRFQSTLSGFRRPKDAPDGAPFVSLYAGGRLCGCYGSDEGAPADRLVRAFLRAAHDSRFIPPSAGERETLSAQVAYIVRPRLLNPRTAPETIEVGTDGVAFVSSKPTMAILLPQVARDQRLGPAEFLDVLARKARVPRETLGEGGLYAFEIEDVVVRMDIPSRRGPVAQAPNAAAAARWLSSLVDAEGAVKFGIDARARRTIAVGEMHHGRSAVVVQALRAHGGHARVAALALARLERDIRSALGGGHVEGWSNDPERVAGTLALAVLAGAPLTSELAAVAAAAPPRTPWHAAQVVAALGPRAPDPLWALCVDDLDRHPCAPWTLIAADARGDREVRAHVARAVATALRTTRPHRGGASSTPVPETALTALCIEGLARHKAPFARSAAARGREFIGRQQLVGARMAAPLDPALSYGAFAASPASDDLRGDITAHALLATLAFRD